MACYGACVTLLLFLAVRLVSARISLVASSELIEIIPVLSVVVTKKSVTARSISAGHERRLSTKFCTLLVFGNALLLYYSVTKFH